MRRILILLISTAACVGARGQHPAPEEYIYPICDVEGLYSANFGEMRPGHFHAGIDIKTDGAEGKPLVAVADGYVSRVSLGAYGYGRAVYLTLHNGTTAVYGHLQRFRKDIEERVREERHARRSNSVNLWFGPDTWPVKQGDVIGYSGNSGSSMGPHLHYELRDTRTQRLYNVVSAGIIRPHDDLPPRIMRIHYIEVDTVQGIPVHSRPESYAVVRSAGGNYRLTREEPVGAGRKGYFVVEASDRRNGVGNTFGLWRLALSADGKPLFEYRMDGFEQANSRCCDAVSYYPLQLTSRNEVIRAAQLAQSPPVSTPSWRSAESSAPKRDRPAASASRHGTTAAIAHSWNSTSSAGRRVSVPKPTAPPRCSPPGGRASSASGAKSRHASPPERSTNRFSAALNAAPPRRPIRRSSSSRPATASSRSPRRCTGQ